MHVSTFLHMYQPPTQKERWVRRITAESYSRLVEGFLANPRIHLTLNINACLIELLEQHGGEDVLVGLRELVKRGQIELTGSVKFHPFLPLLPEKEILHQIELNNEVSGRVFGSDWKPKGFFSPEMAYARNVAVAAKKAGFEWLVLDELAHPDHENIQRNIIYTIRGLENLSVFFRDRHTSFRILSAEFGQNFFTAQMMQDLLGDRIAREEYLVIAMDAETFGHHRPELEEFLFDFYKQQSFEPAMLSDLFLLYPERKEVEPRDSTWALQHRELELHIPFARWSDPKNEIHQLQWELTFLAMELVQQHESLGHVGRARTMLDRSIASDQYWWASAQPWWSVEMMERGAHGLLETIRALPVSQATKAHAENLYRDILYTAFDWQRSGKVDERAQAADEDVTQRITNELPFIPKEELDAMIERLERQMLAAAERREYERATQLRDRIAELRGKEQSLITPKERRK